MPEDGFWRQTPRLYLAAMRGAGERERRAHEARIAQAWHVAAMTRLRKLPPLDKLLRNRKRPVRQSREEMNMMFDILVARCGGLKGKT